MDIPLIKPSRPDVVPGLTIRVPLGCTTSNMYVTVTYQNGKPFEVFGLIGRAGGCTKVQVEAITRCISLGLRYGIPIGEFLDQLNGLECPEPFEGRIMSCADAICHGVRDIEALRKENEKEDEAYEIGG